jgi:2,4-dienoyl-CoA reductase-like NADH-dependent reductase (Old Yellow Enzyme family)
MDSDLTVTLATPFSLTPQVTLKNRFLKSAMSEQLGRRDHSPSAELATLYRTWAEGGTGLLVTGNVMIDSRFLGEPANVVLEDDIHLDRFQEWAAAGSVDGTQVWMQLNHPGKQIPSFLCTEPVAPSAVPLGSGLERMFRQPRALTGAEIEEIVRRFASSAALARQAGFGGVQIHGAHGYLVSQFLSPLHNQRSDEWGGDLERRMRFLHEVYQAIRAAVGDSYPIGIKLNSADFQRGGFSEQESMAVAQAIAKAGIDLIEISGGNYERPAMIGSQVKESTRRREAYFLEYTEQLRQLVDTPIVVTGGFRSGAAMLAALQQGTTDLIGLARPLAVEPGLPKRLIQSPDQGIALRRLTTGLKAVDRNVMLDITWYEHQLQRMGRGLAPQPGYSEWRSALSTILRLGLQGLRRRRTPG